MSWWDDLIIDTAPSEPWGDYFAPGGATATATVGTPPAAAPSSTTRPIDSTSGVLSSLWDSVTHPFTTAGRGYDATVNTIAETGPVKSAAEFSLEAQGLGGELYDWGKQQVKDAKKKAGETTSLLTWGLIAAGFFGIWMLTK